MDLSFLLFAAMAGAPQAALPPDPGTVPKDANEVVCKTQKELRSRISRVKVCMTRAEWAAESRDNKKMVSDVSERTRQRF